MQDNGSPTEHGVVSAAQAGEPLESPIPAKYRDTVRKGLAYLVKNQCPDGHWEGDGGKHPVAMTGLVGLALLMEQDQSRTAEGFEAPVPKYMSNMRKAADWLMDRSQPRREGLIYSEHPSETGRYMEGHGLATIFLAGVCQEERDAVYGLPVAEIKDSPGLNVDISFITSFHTRYALDAIARRLPERPKNLEPIKPNYIAWGNRPVHPFEKHFQIQAMNLPSIAGCRVCEEGTA